MVDFNIDEKDEKAGQPQQVMDHGSGAIKLKLDGDQATPTQPMTSLTEVTGVPLSWAGAGAESQAHQQIVMDDGLGQESDLLDPIGEMSPGAARRAKWIIALGIVCGLSLATAGVLFYLEKQSVELLESEIAELPANARKAKERSFGANAPQDDVGVAHQGDGADAKGEGSAAKGEGSAAKGEGSAAKGEVSGAKGDQVQEQTVQTSYQSYADAPKSYAGELLKPNHAMALRQEDQWRAGLSHRYPYQRFKAARAMRQAKVSGSGLLMQEALRDKKFWTRMEALRGLAAIGEMPSSEEVASIFQGANSVRDDLVARYLKRMTQQPSPGDKVMLRAALPHLGERSRARALQILAKHPDVLTQTYLELAAKMDSSARISQLAQRLLGASTPVTSAVAPMNKKSSPSSTPNGEFETQTHRAETVTPERLIPPVDETEPVESEAVEFYNVIEQ